LHKLLHVAKQESLKNGKTNVLGLGIPAEEVLENHSVF
jgi:hypothetical protein